MELQLQTVSMSKLEKLSFSAVRLQRPGEIKHQQCCFMMWRIDEYRPA